MTQFLLEEGPRVVYVVLSLYALWVLLYRWRVVKLMTEERRWLFLFFVLETTAAASSGILKVMADVPADASVWLTIATQFFLAVYLTKSIPRAYRRFHHRFTRKGV